MERIWISLIITLLAAPAQAALEMHYIHSDHLGTPKVVTNQAQTVVWKGHLKPFGRTEIEIENITQHLRFPGQRFDIETSLHYNFFRDYDSRIGRYAQSDPTGLTGGINTYLYGHGSPTTEIDPLGLWSFSADAYRGLGGGLSFGRDPNGSFWLAWRGGVGLGAGIGFDPDGTSPAYNPCYPTTGDEGSLGVFGKAELALIASVGAEAKAGIAPGKGDPHPLGGYYPIYYANASFTDGFQLKPKLSALLAAGAEGVFYLSDANKDTQGDCDCVP